MTILLGIFIIIALMLLVLKVTWFIIKLTGRLLGFVLGLIGFSLIGVFAIVVVGLAIFAFPIILVLGIIGLIGLVAKAL
ncbi:MAG: hypothetical protein MJ172_02615 [Clostridia bacterium]|nr:hypothetical protein [Clostridia bacterium]